MMGEEPGSRPQGAADPACSTCRHASGTLAGVGCWRGRGTSRPGTASLPRLPPGQGHSPTAGAEEGSGLGAWGAEDSALPWWGPHPAHWLGRCICLGLTTPHLGLVSLFISYFNFLFIKL